MNQLLSSLANIKHLNIRKEGPDEEKVLALDVKLSECAVDVAFLARILGSESEDTVKAAFWDDTKNVLFPGLDPITTWGEIKACRVVLGGLVLQSATLRKFKARIQSEHKLELEFSVTVTDPPSNATAILAEYVTDSIRVSVEKIQEELDFDSEEQLSI